MSALLFGSIGTLADTSELQRQAFNDAFAAHGLSWRWDREEYRELLARPGGAQRIAEYAQSTGTPDVDAVGVHRTKGERFRALLAEHPPALRDGVLATVRGGRAHGHKIALVTSTSAENVATLLDVVPELSREDFDLVVDVSQVPEPKPDPAAYSFALAQLGEDAASAVAIEDNTGGLAAARAADLRCVGFPGSNNTTHDFAAAATTVDALSFDAVERVRTAA